MAAVDDALRRLAAALADRYEVLGQIGEGGMATVYGARDLRHDRQVAIKVLRGELAATIGHDRFLREIHLTAQLNHPRILPLLDSGTADNLLYYVMPFVEGESLRQRLNREGQLPVDEAVQIAVGVCHALEYAHDREIIHRDIKPENILLAGGEAVVADFGVARAVSEAGGTRLTNTGLAVGTPVYMSPEQASGERMVDARSDTYALASVLFEMLTGHPPFQAVSFHALTARKLTESVPQIRSVRETVSLELEAIVSRALARTPADRFATARHFAEALQARSTPHSGVPAAAPFPAIPHSRPGWLPWGITAAALAVLGASLLTRAPAVPPASTANVRFEFQLPLSDSIAQGRTHRFAISADGRRIAFTARTVEDPVTRIYIREIDSFEQRPVAGTEGGEAPFFSPDAEWLGFYDRPNRRLLKVPVRGGTPFVIARTEIGYGASWGEDGTIVFDNGSLDPLMRVSADGGTLARLEYPRAESSNIFYDISPQWLPGAKAVLFTSSGGTTRVNDIIAVTVDGGLRTSLVKDGQHGRFVPPDRLLYTRGRQLWSVPFDPERLEVLGDPVQVMDSVRAGVFEASSGGTLVYEAARPGPATDAPGPLTGRGGPLVWLDRAGSVTPIEMPDADWFGVRLSPDERSLVFIGAGNDANPLAGLWIWDFSRRALRRLGDPDRVAYWPIWTPDGANVVFNTPVDEGFTVNLHVAPADGSGPPKPLAPSELYQQPYSALADGTVAYVQDPDPVTGFDIWALSLVGEPNPRRILASEANEQGPALSPDGRWLAYGSDESGRPEIYVRRWPQLDRLMRLSTDGGMYPAWSHDSRELYYVEGEQRMMVVPFDGEQGIARRLFEPEAPIDFVSARMFGRSYDVARDGRFIAPRQLQRAPITSLRVVVGWDAVLQEGR